MSDTSTQAPVPDELVKAAEAFVRKVECGEARSKRSYAAFKAALSLPRRTEADIRAEGWRAGMEESRSLLAYHEAEIRADERERLAEMFAAGRLAEGNSIIHDVPAFIRSQGGDDE